MCGRKHCKHGLSLQIKKKTNRRVRGDKAAIRANTYFDLIAGTGVTLTKNHIPRRCYRVPTKSETEEDPSQTHFFYTGEEKPTWAVVTALEEEIRSEDLANHKGSLILDTPPEDIPKQEKPRIINRKTRKSRIRGRSVLLPKFKPRPRSPQTIRHLLRLSCISL